jgi:hypothetical protein
MRNSCPVDLGASRQSTGMEGGMLHVADWAPSKSMAGIALLNFVSSRHEPL